jgi:isocitrate/isopropylmalate dehydrogenase
MMMDWLGEHEKAGRVERATASVIKAGKVLTYDMGGNNSTLEMAEEIVSHLPG